MAILTVNTKEDKMGKEELRRQVLNVIDILSADPALENKLFLVLDLLKLVNKVDGAARKGLIFSIVIWIGNHHTEMTPELIEKYRTDFKLGPSPTAEAEPAVESVKTKDTSLYLESFRF